MPEDNAAVIAAAEKILAQEAPPAEPPAETPETQPEPEPRIEGDTAEPETEEAKPEYVPVEQFNRTAYELRKTKERLTRLERGGGDIRTVLPAQPAEFTKPEPTLDSCGGDLEALVRSHEDWKLEKRDFEAARQQNFSAYQRAVEARHSHGQDRLQEAQERFPDFVAKIDSVGLRENKPEMIAVVDALLENDHFAEVGIYLANNPNELKRISVLEGRRLDQEIGKLELKIMAEQALKTNKQKPVATKVENAGAGAKPKVERDARQDFERAKSSGSDPRYWADYILNHKKLG